MSISAHIVVQGAESAAAFYRDAFGGQEVDRIPVPDGRFMSIQLRIGGSVLHIADEFPEMGVRSPKSIGGSPVTIMVYVDDVDATFERAKQAGAKEVRPLENQFYGDRTAQFEDPFGHRWSIATHVEDVSPDEMQRRAAEMAQRTGEGG